MTTATTDPVRTEGLHYAFGDHAAVDDLDLALRPGEVFGLLGPNGAGKTTTIRVITTLLPAPPGTVTVAGLDVARHRRQVRRLLGYVPQQLSADASLTGRENVALFARLFDLPRRDRAAAVDAVLDAMGLSSRPTAPRRRTPAAWSAASNWPRPSSAPRGCWCSTSPPSGSTRWPAPGCGTASTRCAARPG